MSEFEPILAPPDKRGNALGGLARSSPVSSRLRPAAATVVTWTAGSRSARPTACILIGLFVSDRGGAVGLTSVCNA